MLHAFRGREGEKRAGTVGLGQKGKTEAAPRKSSGSPGISEILLYPGLIEERRRAPSRHFTAIRRR